MAALRGGGAVANERGTPAAARKHPGEWVGKRTPGARRLKRDNRLRALEEILADAGVYDYMHQIPQMHEIYDHTATTCIRWRRENLADVCGLERVEAAHAALGVLQMVIHVYLYSYVWYIHTHTHTHTQIHTHIYTCTYI